MNKNHLGNKQNKELDNINENNKHSAVTFKDSIKPCTDYRDVLKIKSKIHR